MLRCVIQAASIETQGGKRREEEEVFGVLTDLAGGMREVVELVREGGLEGWIEEKWIRGMEAVLFGRRDDGEVGKAQTDGEEAEW